MKIRDIGLGAGLLLGGGLTFIGGFAMTFHTPSDNTGIMLVLGAVFLIPGIIILCITLFSWLAAKLYSSSDNNTKSYVKIGALVLLIGWITWPFISTQLRQANAPLDYSKPIFPFAAGTWGGDIVSVQSWTNQETKPLEVINSLQNIDTVKLMGFGRYRITDGIRLTPSIEGFPWFFVEYGEGQKGYMWGGNLCATSSWANGLNGRCPSSSTLPPATDRASQEQQAILDMIEYSHDTLPGTWLEISDPAPGAPKTILVIYPQEGADNDYARRAQNYYRNDIHEGAWEVLPAKLYRSERSTPKPPQLALTVSTERLAGTVSAKIVSLSAGELILSASGGRTRNYLRVTEPAQLIKEWEEQAADRKRIIEASASRSVIEKQAPQAIEGMPEAFEQIFKSPFTMLSHRGKIRSGPGTQFNQVGSLTRGGTVDILAVTNVQSDSFLWYRIRHSNGLEGYVLGALICTNSNWVEGVAHNCQHFL